MSGMLVSTPTPRQVRTACGPSVMMTEGVWETPVSGMGTAEVYQRGQCLGFSIALGEKIAEMPGLHSEKIALLIEYYGKGPDYDGEEENLYHALALAGKEGEDELLAGDSLGWQPLQGLIDDLCTYQETYVFALIVDRKALLHFLEGFEVKQYAPELEYVLRQDLQMARSHAGAIAERYPR